MRKLLISVPIIFIIPATVYAGFSFGLVKAAKKIGDKVDSKVSQNETIVAMQSAPDTQAPTVPTNLTAVAVSSSQINITWTAATDNRGVTSYKLYRDSGATPVITQAGITYSDSNLSASTTYSYRVSACDAAANCSIQSSSFSAITARWTYTTGGYISASPAIGTDGTIYIGSQDTKLYAINPNGSKKWEFNASSYVVSSPAIGADGTIYVGSYDQKLYAINPDGTPKWNFTTGNVINASPAVAADGTIYVGSDKLYAVNPNGTQKWVFALAGWSGTSPAIATDGTIYLTGSAVIYAVNPNGTQKWTFSSTHPLESSPAIGGDGTIYLENDGYRFYAINPDGTQKWLLYPPGSHSSPAIGTDGTIYVGCGSQLCAINPNGTMKWQSATPLTGGFVYSSPAIGTDGTIYVGGPGNTFYALDQNGNKKWEFLTGSVTGAPSIGADGTVYVGSSNGTLYAIYGDTPLATSSWPKFRHNLQNTGRHP